MANRFASRNENKLYEEPVVTRNTSKINKIKETKVIKNTSDRVDDLFSDNRRKNYQTTSRTFRYVTSVLNEAQKQFKIKQLEDEIHSKMTFGMYLSDLLYQDLHSGEHLFDYQTAKPISDIK